MNIIVLHCGHYVFPSETTMVRFSWIAEQILRLHASLLLSLQKAQRNTRYIAFGTQTVKYC